MKRTRERWTLSEWELKNNTRDLKDSFDQNCRMDETWRSFGETQAKKAWRGGVKNGERYGKEMRGIAAVWSNWVTTRGFNSGVPPAYKQCPRKMSRVFFEGLGYLFDSVAETHFSQMVIRD